MSRRRTLDDVLRDFERRLSALEAESAVAEHEPIGGGEVSFGAEETALSEGEAVQTTDGLGKPGEVRLGAPSVGESGNPTPEVTFITGRVPMASSFAPPDSVGEAGDADTDALAGLAEHMRNGFATGELYASGLLYDTLSGPGRWLDIQAIDRIVARLAALERADQTKVEHKEGEGRSRAGESQGVILDDKATQREEATGEGAYDPDLGSVGGCREGDPGGPALSAPPDSVGEAGFDDVMRSLVCHVSDVRRRVPPAIADPETHSLLDTISSELGTIGRIHDARLATPASGSGEGEREPDEASEEEGSE